MQLDVFDSSVQAASHTNKDRSSFIMRFSQYDTIMPSYWSQERDDFLRAFWKEESTLSSAIYSIASRNAAFGWELFGRKEDVEYAQQLLQFADFGGGWQQLIEKTTQDYLTTDNGAFWEVIRPSKIKIDGVDYEVVSADFRNGTKDLHYIKDGLLYEIGDKAYDIYDSPLDLPIGIAHLDSGRVTRTGDKDIPYLYRDEDGKEHMLRWWQVISFVDMPSPIAEMNGVGFCAISRAFRYAHTVQSMSIYKDEKLSGRFNRAIHITNADPDVLNDQIAQAMAENDNRGLLRYSQPVVATTFDPTTVPSVATIDLASIPDGFTEESTMDWYIAILALALGVDYSFLAPLPGKGLGTASQSETMARQARGKSSRLFMDMVTSAINFKGILPASVQFKFNERDTQQETEEETSKQARAKTRQLMIANGEISPQISRQLANDSGDLPTKYLEAMGEADMVPGVTTQGDVNVTAMDEVISEKSKTARKLILRANEKEILQRKQQLLSKKSLVERIKNAASKTNAQKQAGIENEEVRRALELYEQDYQALLEKAPTLERSKFEELLADLIAVTMMAIFYAFSGRTRSQFEEQDYDYLEEMLTYNLDAVENAADAVYGETGFSESMLALWIGSMATVAFSAMLRNPDAQEEKLMWTLGATEHCATCLALDGQVHTVSEWQDSGFRPRSTTCGLLCKGFRCGCEFEEVPATMPSRGSFSGVPTG